MKKEHKIFIHILVDTGNAVLAATEVGLSPTGAHQLKYRLLKDPECRELYDRLLEEKQQKHEGVRDRIREELAYLAFSNLMDFITITPDGQAEIDLSNVTREQMAAISEITQTEKSDGTIMTKIKLIDKKGSLELLGKHIDVQAFKEKQEVTVVNEIEEMTDEELDAELEKLRVPANDAA